MGWFDSLGRRSHRSTRRKRSPSHTEAPPLVVESLESRTLLDASASLTGGILSVLGGPDRDPLDLTLDPATAQLVVRNAGTEVGRFASAAVNSITIDASAGAHNVRIAPEVLQPATIQGGPGKVILRAGGGPTTLIAGDGTSKLIGGAAANLLVGGSGDNALFGSSGNDTLQGGNGTNRLFVQGNDRIVGLNAGDRVVGALAVSGGPLQLSGGALGVPGALPLPEVSPDPPQVVLTPTDVQTILQRAAGVSPKDDGIVAVVDRNGRILGVRVEGNVSPVITSNNATLSFAIDGAVAEARTGAFFGNDQAPLTSRTIQFISQTTMTQREIDSIPSSPDPTVQGPGFMAPIGIHGHFPPNVMFTPQVDLFAIEHTNRDKTTPGGRFNLDPAFIPPGQGLFAPDAYGTVAGLPGGSTQGRGIGTLPGGIPIYKTNPLNGQLVVVGGIGVFFPGTTGFASAENSSLASNYDPTKPDRSLEAELVAVVAIGGSTQLSSSSLPPGSFDFHNVPGLPALAPGFDIPVPPPGRLDLVGITLDVIGPGGRSGPDVALSVAKEIGAFTGNINSGVDMPVLPDGTKFLMGKSVPEGFLVAPHNGVGVTAQDAIQITNNAIIQAEKTRAAIRLPLDTTAAMVIAVADRTGNIISLFRMPDATIFSIDVAVAKARNVNYYNDPTLLQPIDQVPGVPPGVAFTNRTFRYLSLPHFPEGIDPRGPGPFSILNDGGVDPNTGLTVGPPKPSSSFVSVQGHDAFFPGTNFRDPVNPQFQNGIVFFPGSSGLYKNGAFIGGFGISGDGVDQDDVVTAAGAMGFEPSGNGVSRADQVALGGVRLPYQKFNRQPQEP
jgi:uncharacterized protein GlcG (DUF336 family)